MRYFLICEIEELGLEKYRWRRNGGHLAFVQSMVLVPLSLARRRKKSKVCFKRRKQGFETPQTPSLFMFELGKP